MIKTLLVLSVYTSLFVATLEPISGLLGLFFTLFIGLKHYARP